MDSERGQFEVTHYCEISGLGAVLFGNIVEGYLRVGMRAETGQEPPVVTLRGVDVADRISERKFWIGLSFVERPTLDFLQRAFPVGSLVEFREGT